MLKLIRKALKTAERISGVGGELVEGVENAGHMIAEGLDEIADAFSESVGKQPEGEDEYEYYEGADASPKAKHSDSPEDFEDTFEEELKEELEEELEDALEEHPEGSLPFADGSDGEEKAEPGFADDGEALSVSSLLEEIERLRGEITRLERLKREESRILAEISDFCALFPDVPVESLPDEVWEEVRKGAPLAASFALYERRTAANARRIAQINSKNASRSAGIAGTDAASEYFSAEDVRRMSREEVHANYSKIKESMKKWMQK